MTGFDSIDRLLAKAGEAISASVKWNPLVKEVFRRTLRRGKGVRLREMPSQTLVSFAGRAPTVIDYRFKVVVNGAAVQVGFGTVGGYEPKIEVEGELIPISEVDEETGEVPALQVKDDDFKAGRSLLMAKVTLNQSWAIQSVQMVALPSVPSAEPWTGYKLIAILQKQGDVIDALQMVFFNLGHATGLRRASGLAKHWFWAV